jgi:hypothetical protein
LKPDHHDNDPRTTVIIVNNTQPAAAPAAEVTQAPTTVVANPAPAQQPYDPNTQYSQYPQQYPQQYPNQYPSQQQYDPNSQYNQQYNPNTQYNPAGVPIPAVQPVVEGIIPVTPAVEGSVTPAVPTQTPPVVGETTNSQTPDMVSSAAMTDTSTPPVVDPSVETSTTSTTILTNTSVPIVALNNRMGEAVEQKRPIVTDSLAPRSSESKTENGGSHLKYSLTVLSLSLVYQLAIKSLL